MPRPYTTPIDVTAMAGTGSIHPYTHTPMLPHAPLPLRPRSALHHSARQDRVDYPGAEAVEADHQLVPAGRDQGAAGAAHGAEEGADHHLHRRLRRALELGGERRVDDARENVGDVDAVAADGAPQSLAEAVDAGFRG